MVLNNFNLAGKTAIVTGCNTGLGQGMALALAEAGADIVGVNVSDPDETKSGVEKLGRRFLDMRANLSDVSAISDLVAQARTFTGAVHILVNNAGIIRREDAIKIINIASMLSFQGGVRLPSYTASKSGVMGITRLMANEWASHGINVNAIAPGYMATNNTAALRADEQRNSAILDRIPAGRWGKPEDLAGPVVFLASQASDYVNGYTIAVDGGWLAR